MEIVVDFSLGHLVCNVTSFSTCNCCYMCNCVRFGASNCFGVVVVVDIGEVVKAVCGLIDELATFIAPCFDIVRNILSLLMN